MTNLGKIRAPDDGQKLINALNALQPCERRGHSVLFASAYSSIEQALSRGVTQKAVLKELLQAGVKLHPSRFKQLLDAERKAHDESGKRVCCSTCGSPLRCTELQVGSKQMSDGGQS